MWRYKVGGTFTYFFCLFVVIIIIIHIECGSAIFNKNFT